MRLSLVTAPTVEPLTIGEVKGHLHIADDDDSQDTLLLALIQASREHVEAETSRALLTQTWELRLDRFPRWKAPIALPRPPLVSVTSVTYLDSAGASQVWASSEYVVDAPSGPHATEGRIYPAYDYDYPATVCRQDAVTIRYVAGWASPALVPAALAAAMKMLIGTWFENREGTISGTIGEVPLAVGALLAPHRRLTNLIR